jgi:hypothetical protein
MALERRSVATLSESQTTNAAYSFVVLEDARWRLHACSSHVHPSTRRG